MRDAPCLGDEVQDRISGLTGICTGKAEYLYGCKQVLVSLRTTEGGEPKASWLDEGRIVVMRREAIVVPPSAEEREGGPLTCPTPPGG